MDSTTILFIMILILLIVLYTSNCPEMFVPRAQQDYVPSDLSAEFGQYVPYHGPPETSYTMVGENNVVEDIPSDYIMADFGQYVPYDPYTEVPEYQEMFDDNEEFYIPPNIVMGGDYEDGETPLELAGPPPGDDAY